MARPGPQTLERQRNTERSNAAARMEPVGPSADHSMHHEHRVCPSQTPQDDLPVGEMVGVDLATQNQYEARSCISVDEPASRRVASHAAPSQHTRTHHPTSGGGFPAPPPAAHQPRYLPLSTSPLTRVLITSTPKLLEISTAAMAV